MISSTRPPQSTRSGGWRQAPRWGWGPAWVSTRSSKPLRTLSQSVHVICSSPSLYIYPPAPACQGPSGCETLFVVSGFVVSVSWSPVPGLWLLVSGLWLLVCGSWSLVKFPPCSPPKRPKSTSEYTPPRLPPVLGRPRGSEINKKTFKILFDF